MVPLVPSHPYSRSHARREKRKKREHLAGGELHAVAAALSEVVGETISTTAKIRSKEERAGDKKRAEEEKKIGAGKGRTLSERARRKQM